MSFRRIPFQFSTTDPVERQRELEKRFGLPSKNKMFVDNPNPFSMGSGTKDSSVCSSPRLQHRIPIFAEGCDQPIRSSVDSTSSVPENKKPNVRIIPIEVEGETGVPTRHRTFSGPAGFAKEAYGGSFSPRDDISSMKRSMQDLNKPPTKMKSTAGPKVYNIPIKVEGTDCAQKSSPKPPPRTKSHAQKNHPEGNGCIESNQVKKTKPSPEPTSELEIGEEQKMEIDIDNAIKKIDSISEEFKSYESAVKEYNGTGKDKQYRYLDEMLTRCMLRLDDIDTMGNEKVRSARKNAVKKVQTCVDLLEMKISGMKETDKVSENEVKGNEVQNAELKQVSEVSDHVKTEENEIEMVDIANCVTGENLPLESTQVTNSELSPNALLNVNETKTSEKLEDSTADVDTHSELYEANDVEMVNVDFNSKPNESIEETVSKTSQEGLHNTSEVKEPEKVDDSQVNVSEEIEGAVLQDVNLENYCEIKIPCVENSEIPAASMESVVEMNESENTLNEMKDKTVNSDINELQTIPNKEKISLSDNAAVGHFENKSDCQGHESSHIDFNTHQVVM